MVSNNKAINQISGSRNEWKLKLIANNVWIQFNISLLQVEPSDDKLQWYSIVQSVFETFQKPLCENAAQASPIEMLLLKGVCISSLRFKM